MNSIRSFALAAALTTSPLLLAAEPAAPNVTLQLEAGDQMTYNVTALEAPSGKVIKVVLKNVGKLPKEAMGHNFVLLKPGTDPMKFATAAMTAKDQGYIPQEAAMKELVLAHTALAGPGESVEVTFTAPAPGEYPFLCTFPGHVAFMKGVLTVK